MIAFVTSVRHPRHCTSYDAVLGLLDRTLASVCNQTSRRFAVVVVCNEPPPASTRRRDVAWVEVDFAPPSDARGPRTGMPALRLDRGTKYAIGVAHARTLEPDHVMFFDADDFLSRRLAAFSDGHPSHPGWYLSRGYVYDSDSGRVGDLRRFHQVCGTSHVLHLRWFDALAAISPDSSQAEILGALGRDYVLRIIGSHRWIVGDCARRGEPLDELPFAGAVYHVGHGENHTAEETLWTRLVDRPAGDQTSLLRELRREFSVPPPAHRLSARSCKADHDGP